jgi:hypothetical protein
LSDGAAVEDGGEVAEVDGVGDEFNVGFEMM